MPQGGSVDPWRVLSVCWLVWPLGAVATAAVCSTFLATHDRQQISAGGSDAAEGYSAAILMHGAQARFLFLLRMAVFHPDMLLPLV